MAAAGPLLASVTALALNVEPRLWLQWSRPLAQGVVGEAILYSAWALVLIAPLMGVAVGAGRREADRGVRQPASRALGALAVFVATSAMLFIAAWGISPPAILFVSTLHATLASAAVALFALGVLCGVWLRNPLDAAGCALTTALLITAGVLVAGAPVAEAPRSLVNAALIASPLVGIASAAGIDIVRMDVLYHLSPLAHIGFDYPEWHTTSACYLLAAVVCAAVARMRIRLLDSPPIL